MNQIMLAALIMPGGALGLLFKIAIACVIIWGVWALIKWSGISIPQPVIIILTVLVCILVIYWMFQLFALLV